MVGVRAWASGAVGDESETGGDDEDGGEDDGKRQREEEGEARGPRGPKTRRESQTSGKLRRKRKAA